MLSSNPAFTSSQVINLAFYQPAPLTAPANPSTQGTQSTQRPHLSIVLFLKNDPRNKLVATQTRLPLVPRFLRRIRIMLLCRKTVKPFREKSLMQTEKLLNSDPRELALTNLCHNSLASGDSERFVSHLFTVEPDASLLNHSMRL